MHRAGEKLFIDFSGKRSLLVDATTGELVLMDLFVGVLGAGGRPLVPQVRPSSPQVVYFSSGASTFHSSALFEAIAALLGTV